MSAASYGESVDAGEACETTYIGTTIGLPSLEKECECRTSSLSRESSLSTEGIVYEVVMFGPKR
jgi:hypothetical protein